MKKILQSIVIIILTPIALLVLFLIYATITDYKPEPKKVEFESQGQVINVYDTLNIFNWNIGYCGLGDDMSFFYDGGEDVRTTKERTLENLAGIKSQITKHDSIDFYLLQEIDKASRRSYKTNQYDSLQIALPNYKAIFALNYKVAFVPIPPNNPLGRVNSGLATFGKYEPFKAVRHSFPGNYSWPKGMFLLDRCFLVERFYTSNGKELLLINTHNSAYDDGTLRLKQMEVMKEFLLAEYKKGNYVIVGGDWNQNAPIAGKDLSSKKEGRLTRIRIDDDFMPDNWGWHFNEDVPSNRMIDEVYNAETTIQTTIDFFLTSPNVKGLSLKNIDLQFKHSDHQPVLLKFAFNR